MATVLDLAVRVVLLLSCAWAGTTMLRRRSASVGATLWTTALAAALLMPIVSTLVPAWRVPVYDAAPLDSARGGLSSDEGQPAVPVAVSTPATVEAPVSKPVATASTDFINRRALNWAEVLLGVLATVALLLFARIMASYWRLHRVAMAASDADEIWSVLVDDVRRELGITRAVAVRVTEATNVPAVSGVWKPVLLLPAETNEWPLDLRRAVVLHELAHVARWDGLAQLLSQFACATYWFVPLVWFGARRASVLRERASDDVVLRAGMRPSAYAQSLVSLVQSSAASSSAALAMAQPSRIEERVMAILNPRAKREQMTWGSAIAMSVVILGATVVVGAVQPVAREATSSDPAQTQLRPGSDHAQTSVGAGSELGLSSPRPPRPVTTVAAPLPEQTADRLCSGRTLNHNSQSTHEDGKTRQWTVKLSGDGCSVDLRAEGQFEFNPDFTDISSISNGGFFRVDVTDKGVRRQVEIESRGGSLSRTWRVDGSERPYDAAAKAWFAAFLIELDRRTAIGVDIRLPLLLKQGGVDAVLRETAQMESDYPRSRYYANLARAAKLTSSDVTKILKQAATLKTSDYYANELVTTYGRQVQDASVRAALIELVRGMTNDYYAADSIEKIVGPAAPGQAELDVMMQLVPRMSSDHYKTQVLTKVLKADSLNGNHQVAIATAAAAIDSDYYAAEVLMPLARKGLRDDAARRAFFAATAKVENDHYRAQVLDAVLSVSSLQERDLIEAVSATKGMSDHYKAQVLPKAARHGSATDRVRSAVLDAASGMASYYADQVKRAAGK